jgi:hypothetical protein
MRFQGVIGAALLGSSALQHVAASMQPDVEGDIVNIDGDIVNAERLETRQSAPAKIPVTGVTGNGIQPRLELRTMQQQYPDMFNVFLLGLRSFMQVDQSDPLSYYQIAGKSFMNVSHIQSPNSFTSRYSRKTLRPLGWYWYCSWIWWWLLHPHFQHVPAVAQTLPGPH